MRFVVSSILYICSWRVPWLHGCGSTGISLKKKGKEVLTQFGYLSVLSLVCIVKHSDVPLPALDSKQIKNLIRLSRTLANVMGEYFANEIVQLCGKWYETEVTKIG